MIGRTRPSRTALVLLTVGLLLSGCSGGLLQAIPLPFRTGTGEESYQVTVQMADLGNLVPNAEVKVGDITVGTVTEVNFDNWAAGLTVSLEPTAQLPANAEARIGQKSLLGAQYLELAAPEHKSAEGTLRQGDVIPLNRTGRYPDTEELLAALSALLNQGGLAQLQTITSELNTALNGNEDAARELIGNVGRLAQTLDARKGDIVRAIENLDRLSTTLSEQQGVIDNALRTVPQGIAALERQRTTLVDTLESVSTFGATATQVINASKDDLDANLRALRPVLGSLADSGRDLTGTMGFLPTFPFPSNQAFPSVVNGDYGNLYITLDLDVGELSGNFLRGLTIAGVPLLGGSSLAEGLVNSNPLTAAVANEIPLPLGQEDHHGAPPPPDEPDTQQQDGGVLGGVIGGLLGEPAQGGN